MSPPRNAKPSMLATMAGHLEALARRLIAVERKNATVADLAGRLAAVEGRLAEVERAAAQAGGRRR